jgi:ubiquitin C-terminal hydrolase
MSAGSTTLLAALQRLVAVETMSDYFCEHCGSSSTARKQLSLCKLPPVLIFHAKRFRHGIKVNDLLSFVPDELLDMRPFTTAAVLGQGEPAGEGQGLYRMICVIEHIGRTMNGGHYVAYVVHGQRWLKCDDTKVSEVCLASSSL